MDKINSTLSIEQRELLDLHLRYVIEENKTRECIFLENDNY